MNKDVLISIRGKQSFDGSDAEIIELTTSGTLIENDGGYDIEYPESAVTGFEGSVTTFKVRGDRVTLSRTGTVSTEMIFQKGKRHLSLYDVGFGALVIGINAKRVETSLGPAGGTIEIDYSIEIDNLAAGENMFRINIREAGLPQ